MKLGFIALCSIFLAERLFGEKVQKTDRDGRILSLFSIVSFQNDVCTAASDTSMSGTCVTATECSNQGGSADGNCASGFGVCCVFILTCPAAGGTISVSRNCTYIRNAAFPSSATVSTTCSYTINAVQKDICYVRLDFDNLAVTQPHVTTPSIGVCNTDTVVASSPISSTVNGASPPQICGTLTGQHMYVETGNPSAGSSAATLTITHGAASTIGTHKIKVSQIECSNRNRPPSGCVQYFTGACGTIQSYNFQGSQMLMNQFYSNCVRQEAGYCSISYRESISTNPDPFELDTAITSVAIDCTGADAVVLISNDHFDLSMNTGYMIQGPQRCGENFSGGGGSAPADKTPGVLTSQMNTPFTLGFHTIMDMDVLGDGFSLDYSQNPCP